jgi:hypothetical protein
MAKLIYNVDGPDKSDLGCVLAWAIEHIDNIGTPYATIRPVVENAWQAVYKKSWDMFGDVTDAMEKIDNKYPE